MRETPLDAGSVELVLQSSLELLGAYAAWVLAAAAVHWLLPPARRKAWLALSGAAFLASWFPAPLAAALAASTAALHAAGARARRGKEGWPAAALAFSAAAALLLGGRAHFLRYDGTFLVFEDVLPALFIGIYLKKAAYFLYEARYGRLPAYGAADTAVYFFSLPFALGPGVVAAPSHLQESYGKREGRAAAAHGLQTVLDAVLHLAGCWAVFRLFGSFMFGRELLGRLAQGRVRAPEIWAALGLAYLSFYLLRYGYEQLCVGTARLLGFDLRDNYAEPLLASSYAEHWRRWNVHFREMVMAFFYYPVMLRLARARPSAGASNIVAACWTTFFGHGLFVVAANAVFYSPGSWPGLRDSACRIALFEGLQWALVSGSLLRSRSQPGAPQPASGLREAAGIATTFALRAATLPFLALNRKQLAWSDVAGLLGAAFGL
ncbi:MAG: hypothetical protein HY554_01990 [Elusimicrobia bacterium]|nr:hypothetical protein [Elusimicrobiota bacterium]